jgi:hypothetical protein
MGLSLDVLLSLFYDLILTGCEDVISKRDDSLDGKDLFVYYRRD